MKASREKNKTIFFIAHSIYPVADTGGGSIILYRHLKRFEEQGYKVIFIHSIQSPPSEHKTEFEEIFIKKKTWFPPLRSKTPLLTKLRIKLYFRHLKDKIHPKEGDRILSIFGDYTNLLAVDISRHFKLPLFMIYHDDSLFNDYSRENILTKAFVKRIIQQTMHFFAVSEPMKQLLKHNGASSVSLLYPIPQGYTGKIKTWEDVKPDCLSFYNSGALFEDFHYDLIQNLGIAAQKLNGKVKLLGKFTERFTEKLKSNKLLSVAGRVETIADLFQLFVKDADVLLVFYSFKFNIEQRLYHSFPSKFIEYCHLGIPILIIAPSFSSIGKWATNSQWISFLPSDNVDDIYSIMARFREEEYWKACQKQAIELAQKEFDPEEIHQQLSSKLLH